MSDRQRVLVVDDERAIRAMLCDLLAVWGYDADAASSSSEALGLLGQGRYDLIVTDHLMPGGSGLELVVTVRDRDPRVGIIMLTASAPEMRGFDERLGFTLLAKPLRIDRLKAAVRETVTTADQAGR